MKALFKAMAMLIAISSLAGCATGYQEHGLTGGYDDRKLDDNHYLVVFDGNGFADKDRVWYFWFYRCAQLTSEKGYTYFSIEPIVNNFKKTDFTPGEDDARLSDTVLHGDGDGHLIDTHGGGGMTFIYVPGVTSTSWHSKAIVAMYRDNVPDQQLVLRADLVMATLGNFIRSNGKSLPPDRHDVIDKAGFGMTADHQLVNIRDYMATRAYAADAGHLAIATPRQLAPSRQYDLSKGPLLPPGQVAGNVSTPPPPSPIPAVPPPIGPAASENPAPRVSSDLPAAQAVASQIGCAEVQPIGNGTFSTKCSSYKVFIACDSGQCRPQHVIR